MKEIFLNFINHSLNMFKNDFKKLTKKELDLALKFIEENECLDKSEFELKVNRMFIGKELTKNWKIVMQFLSMANSSRK